MENREALEQAILKGLEIANKTGEFVIDQAPKVIEEFIKWHTYRHGILIFLWLIISFILIMGVRRLYIEFNDIESEYFNSEKVVAIGFISCVILFLSVASLIGNTMDLIQIIVTPSIYIMEHFIK